VRSAGHLGRVGGLPADRSRRSQARTIPSVDLSGNDSAALAAAISPNAPGSFNDVVGNVTLGSVGALIPGYEDHMVDFTSEGPARITSALKPDVSAPVGHHARHGSPAHVPDLSGTSMAAPHVPGVAALLTQLHPSWLPAKIKALIMNQATQEVTNLDGTSPVPATVMGSGRVQAFESAQAESLAWPGSLSFRLQAVSDLTTIVKSFTLQNLSGHKQAYEASADVRFTDFAGRSADVRIAVGDEQLATSHDFSLKAGGKVKIHVELALDPDRVPTWQQELGWYFYNPNVDGNVDVVEKGTGGDELHVPWHASALAVSDTSVSPSSLDLTAGPAELDVNLDGFGSDTPTCTSSARTVEDGERDLVPPARGPSPAQRSTVCQGVPPGRMRCRHRLAGLPHVQRHAERAVEFVAVARGAQHHRDHRGRRARGHRCGWRLRRRCARRRRDPREVRRGRDGHHLPVQPAERLQHV
jgi:hypothetical protein